MRTLALDGGMGASGDMLLGALLAAGADRSVLVPVEDALGVRYEVAETDRNGIAATGADVVIEGEHDHGTDPDEGPETDHDHGSDHRDADHGRGGEHDHHDHAHGDEGADHRHGHDHRGDRHDHPAEGHGPARHYGEVLDIVADLDLPEDVEADALASFEILGEAEAAVHGTELGQNHFHEVGADDAIADVVGVALLLDDLGVERVVTTPLSAGGGEVEMSHGTYPVPTPAVVEIAERADWALQGGPVDAELLTPTGAAILARVATGVESLPPIDVETSGYGAGSGSFSHRPNVLRALVGTTRGRLERQPISVLETNLDDTTPEVLGDLQRSLADAGARDVSVVPVTMKKSRPGHLVRVVCDPADAEGLARRLAEETGTLGVREHGVGHRWVADRHLETVTIEVDGEEYDVAVKIATDGDGAVLDASAEYEDAVRVADEAGLPVRRILGLAAAATRDH